MKQFSFSRVAVLTTLIGLTCFWLTYRHNSESKVTASIGGATATTTRTLTDRNSWNFDDARSKVKELLSLIRHRYELDGPYGGNFFLASNNIDELSWNIVKYKFAHKILSKDQSFLMIFGGSSVTAGHDNLFNQSYPMIFQNRMQKIFDAIGVKLVVHNIAQGANNCLPYTHCYESMGGLEPDFLGWEQSYNCGRDSAIFEAVARLAGWPALPAVVYYSASGAWLPKDCPASTDPIPYCAEAWTPETVGLSPWNPTSDDIKKERDLLFKFNQGKPSAARFSNHYRNDYKAIAVHGFNVWEQNPHCSVYDEEKKANKVCNGIDAAAGCKMKFMTQEASFYGTGNGANWHPSRAFHMLRGEAIAWIYSLILHDTFDMLAADLQTKEPAELIADYTGFLTSHGAIPKDPKFCKNYRCEKRPTCFTDYMPHFPSNMTLKELIIRPTSWIYDDYEYPDWSLKYGYLDLKPYYMSQNATVGPMHMRLPVGSSGIVWLCGPVKETLLHAKIQLDPHAADTLDESKGYIPTEKRTEWKSKKYVGAECKELFDLPKGNHVLTIENTGAKTIGLSHIITWL